MAFAGKPYALRVRAASQNGRPRRTRPGAPGAGGCFGILAPKADLVILINVRRRPRSVRTEPPARDRKSQKCRTGQRRQHAHSNTQTLVEPEETRPSLGATAALLLALSVARGLVMISLVSFLLGVVADMYRPAAMAVVADLVAEGGPGPCVRPAVLGHQPGVLGRGDLGGGAAAPRGRLRAAVRARRRDHSGLRHALAAVRAGARSRRVTTRSPASATCSGCWPPTGCSPRQQC